MYVAQASAPAPTSTNVTYSGQNGSGSYTNPYGGTVLVSYSATGTPNGPSAWSASGTLQFTNWYDPSTGYTINGTLSVSESVSGSAPSPISISAMITGNLALSGGTISTLNCNISEQMTIYSGAPYFAATVSGTITANGYSYNVNQL